VQFARETVEGVEAEIVPLLEEHFEEAAKYKELHLAPNYSVYKMAEEKNMFRLFTIRKDGHLVGYDTYFIVQHPHFSKSILARNDLLFIRKPYRGVAMRFLSWVHRELKKDHVDVISHSVTPKKDFSPLLKRLGYTLQEHIYSRRC